MSLLYLALVAALATPASASRDWPMPRHDRTLANRSPLKGDMRRAPRELWRISTAVWAGDLNVAAGKGPATVALDRVTGESPKHLAARGERRKAVRAFWQKRLLDVSGDGKLAEVQPHTYWGKLIPGWRGFQRVAWTSTWGDTPSRLQCFSYEDGLDHPKLEWETPPEQVVYSPLTLIADVNGDGKNEVVVAAHFRIMIFDGATGRKITELRYHHKRNYGFFGLFFEPGDPNAKFVNISDFASHFDVIDYNGSDMVVAFRRDIEGTEGGGIERHMKIIANGPNPLEDIDGDGHVELAFNLFNDTGDEQWHVMAYAPLTGTVKLDLPGWYLDGLYDVDGCGTPELLLQSAPDRQITGWTTLRICKLRRRKLQTLATYRNARFAMMGVTQLPATADDSSPALTAGAERIGPHGEPGFLLLRPGRNGEPARLQAYVCRKGTFVRDWSIDAPAGGTIGARRVEGRDYGETVPPGQPAHADVSVTAPAQEGSAPIRGATASALRWSPSAPVAPQPIVVERAPRPPIAGQLGRQKPPLSLAIGSRGASRTAPPPSRSGKGAEGLGAHASRLTPHDLVLLTDTSADEIAAYELPTDLSVPKLLWRRPGRGMGTGSGPSGALSAGDLTGDGKPDVLYADEDARSGSAELVACGLDGQELWRRPFPGYDSGRPVWNEPGLTLWTPAHLTSRRRLDVYVNLRRSSMHSDVSFALDGRTGKALWSGDAVPIDGVPTWGFGGMPVGCADFLGNGLDQIVSLYPVCYYVVDGRTGRFVRTLDLASEKVLPGWAAYGLPVVRDFLGNGGKQVLVASPYVYGLLTPEGKAIWSAATVPANGTTPGVAGPEIGDYDGDGKLEIARLFPPGALGPEARLEFLDATTGKPKGAALTGPGLSLTGAVTADVDGDGADELLLRVAPATLAAVSLRGGKPRELWRVKLPADPVCTIVTDIASDGRCDLIAGCADGSIVALGSK